jgi:small-conductance mechanosensitive channel
MQVVTLIAKAWGQNTPREWLLAGSVAALTLGVGIGLRRWARRRPDRPELADLPLDVARKTSLTFLIAVAALAAVFTLELPDGFRSTLIQLVTLIAFWQLAVWGSTAVVSWLSTRRREALQKDPGAAGSLSIIGFALRALVWGLTLLLALENLGVDVTALVAGLGVGGIAVALAVQNVLGDVFASLSISLDRPFVIGDFVVVGDFKGTVEHIGIKSTRLRSLGGEQIIIANADLLGSRIRNFGQMAERRVIFSISVTFQTPHAKLKQIPALVQQVIERQADVRFERCHLAKYGASAFEFEAAYFFGNADFNLHMDAQEAILFEIHEALEQAQIALAYPTQTLWLEPAAERTPSS